MKTYIIDGTKFSTLDEFYDYISKLMELDDWGRNLDALNDVLYGDMGNIPNSGITILWKHSDLSRKRLGTKYPVVKSIMELHKNVKLVLE